MKERRRYKRFSLLIPLKIQRFYSNKIENTITRDISQGGLRIKSECFFMPKERIKILLDNPLFNAVNGRIVWIKKMQLPDSFEAGIEFIELDSYTRKLLFLKFLNFNL